MGKDGAPSTVGSGENSCARHSTFQRGIYENAKKVLEAAIRSNLDLSMINGVIRVADLGCAVGPNTFYTVQNIIEIVLATIQTSSFLQGRDPEFQVFFNDQVGNDFNVLFSNLPPQRGYFPAGVPGSFHSRLFPRDSIHFFNSTMALHWLSKPPDGVANKGRIHYFGGGPEIRDAYLAQFSADLEAFLTSRALELKEGGLISIMIMCRDESTDPCLTAEGTFVAFLEPILHQLLQEGKVMEKDLDAFQIPLYSPTIEEFMEVVEVNGRYAVRVAQTSVQESKAEAGGLDGSKGSLEQSSRSLSAACRAVLEELLQRHFGQKNAEEIFRRVPKQIEHYLMRHGSSPKPPEGLFILQLKPSASASS